ncbi:glycosyltransferase family 39 protein [Candidatus Borrarchaeum sp.]|uniref:ArnT family glycosyltransferase n=1 Tax=Candidatus Borrarchaeum sp. TaxID=2846742 RepID=UPI00257C954A|nr:glycosyltransferase family 39 protein [Candidatus Borrarchaeum sp.]
MQKYNKYTSFILLILIVALGFLLRVYNVGYPLMKVGDEVEHAIVANNAMKHFSRLTLFDDPYLAPVKNGGWRDWPKAHVWLNKPPFSFWLIALFMFIFGPNEFGYRITAVLLGTCSLFITFLISRRLFGERTGYLAAFIQAICPITVLFDRGTWIPGGIFAIFSFWLELTVLCIIISYQERKNIFYIFAGLFSGISYLSLSFVGFIPILALVISLFYKKLKNKVGRESYTLLLYVIIVSSLIIIPWEINSFLQYGRVYPTELFTHLTVSLAPSGPWYYHLEILNENLLGPLFILFILGFITHFKRIKHSFSMSDLYLLSLILPSIIIFSLAKSKFPHFLFPIYPYFYIIISNFLSDQTDLIRQKGFSLFHLFLVAFTFIWVINEIQERFLIFEYIMIPFSVLLFSFLLIDSTKYPYIIRIKQEKTFVIKLILFFVYLIGACLFGPFWIFSKNVLGKQYFLIVSRLIEFNQDFSFFGSSFFISIAVLIPFLYIFYNKQMKKSRIFFPRVKISIVLFISLLFISGTLITLLGWTTQGWACLFNQRFQYREVGYFIRENTDPKTVIYGLDEIDSYKIMFYSDRTALPGYPSLERINELKLRGYDVLILSNTSQVPYEANLIYAEEQGIFLYVL